jgi:hypothetical protein
MPLTDATGTGTVGNTGRPLDRAERRAAIEAALKARPEASNRTVAALLGVDHTTVGDARRRLEDGGGFPHHGTRIGRDGVAQPARKPKRPATDKPASSAIDADLGERVAALERREAANAVVALTVAKICEHIGLEAPSLPLGSEWIQIKEAAARLEYSESGIRNLIRRGKVESMITPAGKVRIRAASLPKCE